MLKFSKSQGGICKINSCVCVYLYLILISPFFLSHMLIKDLDYRLVLKEVILCSILLCTKYDASHPIIS